MLSTGDAPQGLRSPPLPRSPRDLARVEHQRLRRRILYSMHEGDVRQRIYAAVGTTRASAWRIVDMTSNPAWYICSQLAALYRDIPELAPPDGGEEVAAAIAEAGYWQLAQRVQRDTIGLNDTFVRVDVDPEDGSPRFRLVPPDLVGVTVNPLAPGQPLALTEWVEDPDDPDAWVQLVTDPRTRRYDALDADGKNVSERVLGGRFSGEAYPFLVGDRAVLPYVAYHATETGLAFDPYSGREVFDGTLQLGLYYSFFGHVLRQAAWSQRWALGAEPDAADVDESGRRLETATDPATLAVLRTMEDGGGQAQVGQWTSPVDPDRMLASVERYERRVVEMALSQVGVSRRESDVRSAMSLAVSREAQRDAQRAYEPVFRRSDLRLARLVAGLMGAPTEGWRIRYKALPRDPAELESEVQRLRDLLAAKLIDRVSAYQQLHPGLLRDEAERAIVAMDAVDARLKTSPDHDPESDHAPPHS